MFSVRLAVILIACSLLPVASYAQWELQNSGTTSELRGVDNAGNGVVWASGTKGTVLRTEDGGKNWHRCSMPIEAGDLDFRGIQALDADAAIAMASGLAGQSRLYKTTDACETWRLVLTNPDHDGYFDAFKMVVPIVSMRRGPNAFMGRVIGDPVRGRFSQFESDDSGDHWTKIGDESYESPSAEDGEQLFAASNSALLYFPNGSELFVTGGLIGARSRVIAETIRMGRHSLKYVGGYIPVAAETVDSGAFSVAIASTGGGPPHIAPDNKEMVLYVDSGTIVAVGGNFKKPWLTKGTAAFSTDSGVKWTAASTTPHGYRSSVAYDATSKTWIAVGLNGTDISINDGKDWVALKPSPGEPDDADKNWNALSLPYVVGPNGRIGLLRSEAFRNTSR